MTCILKRPKRYRVTLKLNPPKDKCNVTVTSISMAQATLAARTLFKLGPDRVLHVERVKRTWTKSIPSIFNY
ncbi:MAG: hypothetical protein PHX41_07725 [Kiritimatiellae bacterium]|jgi:hypothetical protein|nr:hypothetical protein [Kiritimatiellia bacterium]MDX9794943.1 hypothetical protein [Kiritimatiellia bacterium]